MHNCDPEVVIGLWIFSLLLKRVTSICHLRLLKEHRKEHFNTTPSFLCSLQGPYELVPGAEFGLKRIVWCHLASKIGQLPKWFKVIVIKISVKGGGVRSKSHPVGTVCSVFAVEQDLILNTSQSPTLLDLQRRKHYGECEGILHFGRRALKHILQIV